MNGRECAKALGIPSTTACALIRNGYIKARKDKGKFVINAHDITRFKRANARAVDKLKAEYVRLYWQGLSAEHLQRRVVRDFEAANIVLTPIRGFAERCIYESLPKRGQGKER